MAESLHQLLSSPRQGWIMFLAPLSGWSSDKIMIQSKKNISLHPGYVNGSKILTVFLYETPSAGFRLLG
jgi:hypothetical protein